MAAEKLFRDLPHTEDSCRFILEWLDRIESERTVERMGDSDKNTPGEELAENGSTASRGGPASDENRSTERASQWQGRVNSNTWQTTKEPRQRYYVVACSHRYREDPVQEPEPLQSEDTQLVLTHISIQRKLIAYDPLAIPCLCFLLLGSKSLQEGGNGVTLGV